MSSDLLLYLSFLLASIGSCLALLSLGPVLEALVSHGLHCICGTSRRVEGLGGEVLRCRGC